MGRRARAGVVLLVAGVIGLLMAASGGAAGGEAPVVVPVGFEGGASFDFGVAPRSLPKGGGPAELKLSIGDELPTGVPPGIAGATIRLDKAIGLDLDGVPNCFWGVQVDAAGPNECADAVVGHADATVLVTFPEAEAMWLEGEGSVYRIHGTWLLLKLGFTAPVSGTIALVAPVRHDRELSIKIPQITGGFGHLTSLHLDLERPYVTAECDRGKLHVSANVVLGDGTEGNSEAIRACTTR